MIKLVIKRKSDNQYEVEPKINKTSASSNAAQAVEIKPEEPSETLIPFTHEDIVQVDRLSKFPPIRKPFISIDHSIPFPVALVEDKTNIVYTKALLLIHLFKSLSSQCIMCVLCKKFFNINQFTSHHHYLDEEDESSSDSENKRDYEKSKTKTKKTHQEKKFKILPYNIGSDSKKENSKFKDEQLRTWKQFSERFAHFKRKKQENAAELDTKNWDHVNASEKLFVISSDRLDNEKIVYTIGEPDPETKTYNRVARSLIRNVAEKNQTNTNDLTKSFRRLVPQKRLSKASIAFNMFENESNLLLRFLVANSLTVVPLAFIDYQIASSRPLKQLRRRHSCLIY